MKTTLLTIILCIPLVTFGQIDFKNPPWEIGCDDMETQTQMNSCSYRSFKIADSILTQIYKKMIDQTDSRYSKEVQEITDKSSGSERDYVASIKSQKASIIASHADFKKFRDSMTDIIAQEYAEGSIRPQMVNNIRA